MRWRVAGHYCKYWRQHLCLVDLTSYRKTLRDMWDTQCNIHPLELKLVGKQTHSLVEGASRKTFCNFLERSLLQYFPKAKLGFGPWCVSPHICSMTISDGINTGRDLYWRDLGEGVGTHLASGDITWQLPQTKWICTSTPMVRALSPCTGWDASPKVSLSGS